MRTAARDVDYRVRFDEAGADGRVHAGVLLAWAQDAAWVHSTSLGFGRDWYAERGLTWLVRAAELVVVDPPSYGDEVAVRTEVTGFRRVVARRLTTVRGDGGRLAARATTDWALLDARGRPTRIPDVFAALADVGPFAPLDVRAIPTGTATTSVAIAVRARDVDPMGHANNGAYVGYVDEALDAAGFGGLTRAIPRTYRLAYLRPATPSMRVSARVAPGPVTPAPADAGVATIVRVVLERDADELLRAEVERA